ncbi:MAG: RDD family protein, partial [Methanocellales archaeon]|nr:RDD family protein [Methanocellales archaeon]MDD3421225.1 RDD family protein [Methanocellales archaeon]
MDTIHLAKWGSRFWAWVIDILLVSAFSNIVTNPLGFPLDFDPISTKSFGVSSVLIFAYWTLFEGYKGQSVGKMALNLKVTDRKGEKIDFGIAALESFGKAFILPLDCLIGWLAMPNSKLRLFN